MEQTESTQDALYTQAILSLKKLNQEVFLTDLEKKLTENFSEIQFGVEDLKRNMEEDFSERVDALGGVVQSAGKQTAADIKNLDGKVGQLDGKVRQYMKDLYNHFTSELEQLRVTLDESTASSKQLIALHAAQHEAQLQFVQAQQVEMIDQVRERVKVMEDLYDRSVIMLQEFRVDTGEHSAAFNKANHEQGSFLATLQAETNKRLTELERMIQSVDDKHAASLETGLTLLKTAKQDLLDTLTDVTAARTELDQTRLTWEQTQRQDLIVRSENEVVLRQQMMEELKSAQAASLEAARQQLRAESDELLGRDHVRDRNNRLFLIGLSVLSGVQIVLHFV